MVEATSSYVGQELDVFSHAHNWKNYWQALLAPYVKGDVVEVGGGIGANTPFFAERAKSLLVLEPDAQQASRIPQKSNVKVLTKSLKDIEGSFDSIFYIDVLEHIENDKAELAAAFQRLRLGGVIIVLSPAYPFLFSPFDQSIGHYRRYTRQALTALAPANAKVKTSFYLDSVGSLASFANKLLLKQSMPTHGQMEFWDKILVPLSRLIDPLIGRMFGKTIVVIFEKA